MTWTAEDYQFMSRAIQLARNGLYTCDPNPRVGCVITKDHNLISEGWHAVAGQAHAEIHALDNCDNASGSTVYITLEPCSHQGRTGPCVEALIKANVDKVIISMVDPNPLVSGSGIEKLEQAGIQVEQGLMENESIKLNPGFIKRMQKGLPYVRCKMAMSIDGHTALANGESQWISSEISRRDAHRYRARSSAILSSITTVQKDNPGLNARDIEFECMQPIRVIFDRKLSISSEARLFTIPGKIIIYTENNNQDRINELSNENVEVSVINDSENGLKDMLLHLAQHYDINELMVESGPTFSGALLSENLVDELILYMAPKLLGQNAKPLFNLNEIISLKEAPELKLNQVVQLGSDLRLNYSIE